MNMDMDMPGEMDGGGATLFQPTNKLIARLLWYIVAAVVALYAIRRCCDALRNRHLKSKCGSRTDVPSRPTHFISQLYDTTIAIFRESTYPQLPPLTGSFTRYFGTLTLGQTLLLVMYWTMILIMLWTNVILSPSSNLYGFKWEIVGFRAAWVSLTQLPLVYCLSGKANVVSLATGISYERLNWLHRWVARTTFLTVIVHWSFFFREWWLAGMVANELKMMTVVKYGFGAWAVIGWSVITGFGLFRTQLYELWLLQHLASAAVLLWLLHMHVPAYARYNVWMAVGFVVFDRGLRGIWSILRNLHVSRAWKKVTGADRLFAGFDAEIESHEDGYMSLNIKNVDFSWGPGQHVYISMPGCGIFESHPFTIANIWDPHNNSLQLYLKRRSGFTGRLHRHIQRDQICNIRTFLSGPWGNPPISQIERCNSLVLVASSTGASYTIPLLEYAVKRAKYVRRMRFFWVIRHASQLQVFIRRITRVISVAGQVGVEMECRVYVTAISHDLTSCWPSCNQERKAIESPPDELLEPREVLDPLLVSVDAHKSTGSRKLITATSRSTSHASHTSHSLSNESGAGLDQLDGVASTIILTCGRPKSWDDLIHPVLVEAEGETTIVACGGRALMADVRNYVAWVSDQRAVHKGTGAQGIFLHTETYGW